MAARIRELGIDLLVDLKGATYDTLLPVLAQRPGAAAGDLARLSRHHRRALHRLPDRRPRRHAARRRRALQREDRPAAALLPAERRPPRPAAALDARRLGRARRGAAAVRLPPVVQDLAPRCSTSGARCCTRCPRPVLWLLQWNTNVQAALTKAAAERGIGAERLVFAPLLPLEGHLSRLAHADVYPRRLAVQRPHHRRRGAVGRRAGGDDRGPDLRPARRREPAAHLAACRELVCGDVDALSRDRRRAAPTTRHRRAALARRACRPSDPPTRCSTAPPSPPTSSRSTGACGSAPSPASGPSTCPPSVADAGETAICIAITVLLRAFLARRARPNASTQHTSAARVGKSAHPGHPMSTASPHPPVHPCSRPATSTRSACSIRRATSATSSGASAPR